MSEVFKYSKNSEYRGRDSFDEWRIDVLGGEIKATSIHQTCGGSKRSVNHSIPSGNLEDAFDEISQMDESPENLLIDDSNEYSKGITFNQDGFSQEPGNPVLRSGRNNLVAKNEGAGGGEVVFYSNNPIEQTGWTKNSGELETGDWRHQYEGELMDLYSEVVGTPEEYNFRVPSNLVYDPEELPLNALNMLSRLHNANAIEENDLFAEILEGEEIQGREWAKIENTVNTDGLINQMTDAKVLGVQGSVIPEKLEETWKRGVENAERR